MVRLIVLGGSGQGEVVYEAAVKSGRFGEVRILDDTKIGSCVLDVKIEGGFDSLADFDRENTEFIVALGDNETRKKISTRYTGMGYRLASVIHPAACISPSAVVGEGTYVGPMAVIQANASVGRCAIINTAAVVEHDNVIGDYVHLSPGVRLAGKVTVGELTWMGTGSVAIDRIDIGEGCIIGAGSVIIRSVKPHSKVVGVPGRYIG